MSQKRDMGFAFARFLLASWEPQNSKTFFREMEMGELRCGKASPGLHEQYPEPAEECIGLSSAI